MSSQKSKEQATLSAPFDAAQAQSQKTTTYLLSEGK